MAIDDILTNAERLLSDARYLCDAGRHRSAATLIVVALEHFGSFVEELTSKKYPGAQAHIGIFESKSAHARRQDALAAHVMNFAQGQVLFAITYEGFYVTTGCGDSEKYLQWLKHKVPIAFTQEQKQRIQNDPDFRTATLLMNAVLHDRLKMIREYGMYENAKLKFSDGAVLQILSLADNVRDILQRSRHWVSSEPMRMAGINLPKGIVSSDDKESQTIPSISDVLRRVERAPHN